MIEEPRLKPECHGDTLLIKMILKKTVDHVPGNGNIATLLSSEKHKHGKFICVTDNDKKAPPEFNTLKIIRSFPEKNPSLILKQKAKTQLYLIVISPALEKWLLRCCEEIDYKMDKYAFLKNLDALKNVTKDFNVERNHVFKEFLNDLIQKNPTHIATLRSWIREKLN